MIMIMIDKWKDPKATDTIHSYTVMTYTGGCNSTSCCLMLSHETSVQTVTVSQYELKIWQHYQACANSVFTMNKTK